MLSEIADLLRKAFEKDEKTRKYAVDLADSYLRRIRRFQDQLVLLGIVLNFTAAGCALKAPKDYIHELKFIIAGSFLVS